VDVKAGIGSKFLMKSPMDGVLGTIYYEGYSSLPDILFCSNLIL